MKLIKVNRKTLLTEEKKIKAFVRKNEITNIISAFWPKQKRF